MQQHLQESDKRIEEVFRRLDEGNAKPKQGVFYNGQVYDAYTFVSDFLGSLHNKGCPSNWTPCLLASLKYCFEAFVGGTGIAVDVVACCLACLGESFWG